MVDVQFVKSEHSDSPRILPLLEEFYAAEHLPYREEVARRALEELWSNPALGRLDLILGDGELVGYVVLTFGFSLEFRGRDALVDEFYIREPFRGRGIGTACLRWLEQLCRGEGIHALHLEVDHANDQAKRLYHRAGYRSHDRHLLTKWLTE